MTGKYFEPAITASTGIAATHIGGMTIHSWSGIGIKTKLDKYELNKIVSNQYVAKRVRPAKVLIIEEVSMLLPEMLSMVDAVCREIKQSSDPFGGLQVVFAGDFFQLPPVVKTETENGRQTALLEESPARFAYDSPAWIEANPTVCYLTEQHRQDDRDFLAMLLAIRRNNFNSDHLHHLEKRKIEPHLIPDNVPKLFSHNANVDRINDEILAKLPGGVCTFTMSCQGQDMLVAALKRGCLSPEALSLKVGAAVMFTKNNPKEGFVNGTVGVIEGFNKTNNSPFVKTRNGKLIEVELTDWTVEENGKVRAQISQLPLRLAWAITVHKSQGMNLDEAAMDLSDVFEFGQGYVALSRVRQLSGLYILGWNERAFQVHPEILAKDTTFRTWSEEAVRTINKAERSETTAKHERFLRACGGKVIPESRTGFPKMSHVPRPSLICRWEHTLALILSGKTIADVAKICGRSEGKILEHLESLHSLGKLSAQDMEHLMSGTKREIFKIRGTFGQSQSRQSGFKKIREIYPNAYRPWDKEQDKKLRELFAKGASVTNLAKTLGRKNGAIRSRLIKLGLVDE